MKASRRAWTAAKLLALTSAIAVSCALPGYDIGDPGSTGASQAGSEGATASGAGGAGGEGGTGGQNTMTSGGGEGGTGGQNTNVMCPPPDQPAPTDACSVPSDIGCEFRLDCCSVKGFCKQGKWSVPTTCPPGCPTFPFEGKSCGCQANEVNHVCADATACQANGVVEFVKCDGQKWTGVMQAPCCTPEGKCAETGDTCVHFSFNGGDVAACRPNTCAGMVSCDCVDQSDICFGPDLFGCKEATANGIACTNPPPQP